jgi:hypothetical protein
VSLLERLQVGYEFRCLVLIFACHRNEVGHDHAASNRYWADIPMVAFVTKRNLAPTLAIRRTPIRKRVTIADVVAVEFEVAFLYINGAISILVLPPKAFGWSLPS